MDFTFQDFDFDIIDKKGSKNVIADHLSRIDPSVLEKVEFDSSFPDEQLFAIFSEPWYAHIANFLVIGRTPEFWNAKERHRFLTKLGRYIWVESEGNLYKQCKDEIIRKCVPEMEQIEVLKGCHDDVCGGHMSGRATAYKVLHAGFIWPTLFKDAMYYAKCYDRCQRFGGLTKRGEMPQ